MDLGIPSGTYIDITSREGVDKLYLARDGASGSHVDVYDISDQSMEFDFLTTDFIDPPIAITDGPKDQLHLIGAGRFMTIGADDGAVFSQNDCLGFTGSYVSITNLSQETTAAPDRRLEAPSLLHWAQPNPTRRASTIQFSLQRESGVRVALYDVRGGLVRTLWEARAGAGLQTVPWDGFGAGGRRLPTGVYFYVIEAGEARASGRINLLR